MRLQQHLRESGYHSCLTTSFGIGFDAWEALALPALQGAGCRNNAILTDHRLLTAALGDPTALPRGAGRLYSVAGAATGALFHPKVWVQIGRQGGRLTIGSANLTIGGLSGNLELMASLTCKAGDDGAVRLIARACAFVESFAAPDNAAFAMQSDWMRARAPWLQAATATDDMVVLEDGTEAALLFSGEESGIGARFCDLVGGDPVDQLIAISPYWDGKLAALADLRDRLSPGETAVVIDPRDRLFPGDALDDFGEIRLCTHAKPDPPRFGHAKAMIVRTQTHDHLLIGSANCTRAALGTTDFAGENVEACLYRRLPAGAAVKALGLAAMLETRINPADLEPCDYGESIPFETLGLRNPGSYTLDGAVLHRHPAPGSDPEAGPRLDLLDASGTVLVTVSPKGEPLRYPLDPVPDTLAFARVAEGADAVPGIVTRTALVRAAMREPYSGKLTDRLARLSEEGEVSLNLLELVDMLGSEEPDAPLPAIVPRRAKNDGPQTAPNDRTLNYAAFTAGRRVAMPGTPGPFAQDGRAMLQGFLNRLVGLPDPEASAEPGPAFDTGDETADPEADLEEGQSFAENSRPASSAPPPAPWQAGEEAARNRAAIVHAVEMMCERLGEKGETGTLTPNDMLRLRIMLQVICTAGWLTSDKTKKGKEEEKKEEEEREGPCRSVLHVLPVEGSEDADWPRLLGRLLFVMFGKPEPAITGLRLDRSEDFLPSDVTECLTVCLWCLQASLLAPASSRVVARNAKFLWQLNDKTYSLIGMARNDLLSEPIMLLMSGMCEKYADHMGVDSQALINSHRGNCEKLHCAE